MAEDYLFNPPGEVITIANPAAGSGPQTFTAGTQTAVGSRVQPQFISLTLATSVTVANRSLFFTISRGGTTYYTSPVSPTQAASLTVSYEYVFQPLAATIGTAPPLIPTPSVTLAPGDVITWTVANIQAADQVSAQVYTVAVL